MKIIGLAIILFCPLFIFQSVAKEELPDGYQYVFPNPGSKYVHATTTIILRFENIEVFNFLEAVLEEIKGDL